MTTEPVQWQAEAILEYVQPWNGQPFNFLNVETARMARFIGETKLGQTYVPWDVADEATLRPVVVHQEMYDIWTWGTYPKWMYYKLGLSIQSAMCSHLDAMLDVRKDYDVTPDNDIFAHVMHERRQRIGNVLAAGWGDTIWYGTVARAVLALAPEIIRLMPPKKLAVTDIHYDYSGDSGAYHPLAGENPLLPREQQVTLQPEQWLENAEGYAIDKVVRRTGRPVSQADVIPIMVY